MTISTPNSILGHELANRTVAPGNLEFYQKIRELDVLHSIEPSYSSHAQSAGQIGFAAAGGSQQDDVVVLLNVGDFAERCTHSSTALCFTSR